MVYFLLLIIAPMNIIFKELSLEEVPIMKLYFFNRKQIGRFMVLLLLVIVTGVGIYGYQGSKDVEVTGDESLGIYRGNTEIKAMTLTFNVDWGETEIPKILRILKENNVKATFYLTGRWADKFPKLAKQIASEGHEIGNHSYSHPHVDNLSISKNIAQIKKAENSILKNTGQKPRLYAPPYGEKKEHVKKAAAQAGYVTVYWTIDTIDWQKERTPQIISDTVLKKAQNGAIVLMHPVPNTVEALPEIILGLKERGYSLKTVSEIIE
ncbi:MAG: hypothetical protein PWQ96_600 [Clostridia bacterium]|nr:hypothetical protein [Clostridia bacterium]